MGSIQTNTLQPIVEFIANAITEPNISMPPMHMEIKKTPLEATMTLD
jgi:hypothetical protein